jgi:hypothetical protein
MRKAALRGGFLFSCIALRRYLLRLAALQPYLAESGRGSGGVVVFPPV